MKLPKVDQLLDIKTGNSQQSDVDLFSKLQASFLQKFFKYNLSDNFSQMFSNVYQDVFDKKISSKLDKSLALSLFVANQNFQIDQFSVKIQNFYNSKSKSIGEGHLPFAFKKLYCNNERDDQVIKKQQIILVDVKIKAQVMKIQEVPQKILKALSNFKASKKQNLSQIQKMLSKYKGQFFNIFFIYFGDVNFHIFNKKSYQTDAIKLMGSTFKLRISVFFVSKQALIQTFKLTNKIQNLQFINDLVIQFYELKRQKQRRKRIKEVTKNAKVAQVKEKIQITSIALGVVGVLSLTIFGIAIKKIFF